MQQNGVIFDLDGTLVHSSPDIAHHLNTALQRLKPGVNALTVENVELLIGGGIRELVVRGMQAIDVTPDPELVTETVSHFRDVYEEEPVIHTALYDGVADLLTALGDAGYAVGICTNKREKTARLVLDHFGLDGFFGTIIGGDTTAKRKPEPDPLLEAARQLDLMPEATVMVGDSAADFGAARAASTGIIMVDWGYSGQDARSFGADAVISSYAEFLPHLSSILAPSSRSGV